MTIYHDILAELRKTNAILEEIERKAEKLGEYLVKLAHPPMMAPFAPHIEGLKPGGVTYVRDFRNPFACSQRGCPKQAAVETDNRLWCREHVPSRHSRSKPAI